MEKLTHADGATPDMVAENIERLRELFPEVFADGYIDFESLKETLGEYVDDRDERYSFSWHGKAAARQIAQQPSMGTLRPCPEESVNWDTTKNIFIEGDNLEVLKLLQKSYHRKVKMIYIDPPYNTGNEFIYPDKFKDNLDTYLRYTGQVDDEGFKLSANAEIDGRYHTNWLNMMYPRLKLARNLLEDDGVVCVSIDQHECFNLRRMLDEIFGSENHIATIAVSLNPKGRQLSPFFATSHEYVIFFARSIDDCSLVPATAAAVNPKDFPKSDDEGNYRLLPLRNTNKKFNPKTRPNLHYPLFISPGGGVGTAPKPDSIEVWPVFGSGSQAVWRWGKPKSELQCGELLGREVAGRLGTRWDVFQKDYLTAGRKKKLKTVWLSKDVGSTDAAVKELKELDISAFDTPKPLRLLQRIISLMPPDSLVLDFFAGSGTTAAALMKLNEEDNGRRRFMLVQLPEPMREAKYQTIAGLCRARISAMCAQPHGITHGFRAFSLAGSNIKPWDADFDTMNQDLFDAVDNIKSDRTEHDVLYELLLKYGLDLAIPTENRTIEGRRVTVIGAGALVVCLAKDITLEVVNGIAALKAELTPEVMRVVFKDSGFADDVVKTNANQILRQAGVSDVKSL